MCNNPNHSTNEFEELTSFDISTREALFLHTRIENQKMSSGRTSDQRWGFTRQKENEQLHSKRQLPKKIAALTNSP
jgi:hypothetical protein